MLDQLHELVARVCPIRGLSQFDDGHIEINFADEATPDQQAEAQHLVANWTPPREKRLIWSLDFMDRFPETVQLAIVTAAQSNPEVRLWYDRLLAAGSVDLNNQRLIAGLYAMKALGLLTQEQIDAALS